MANVSELITLGIGTPSSIRHLVLGGLSPSPVVAFVPPAPIFATMRVEMALGGSWRKEVSADAPDGWWRFGEGNGTAARDASGNARHGTHLGGPTLAQSPLITEGGYSVKFDGTNDCVTMGDVPALAYTGAFSAEFWIKSWNSVNAVVVGKALSNTRGWGVTWAFGKIEFFGISSTGATIFDIVTTATYGDDIVHHVACTWDGTTGANKVIIYVDGVSVKTGTASAGTPAVNTARFSIGSLDLGGFFLDGTLDDVMVYHTALSPTRVAVHRNSALWTDVTRDVLQGKDTTLRFGISGNGPKDRVASMGILSFTLRNDERNSAGLLGYYSPSHANHRAGFSYGTLTRVVYTYKGTDYPRFIGKIASVSPQSGRNLSRQTEVIVHDLVDDLIDTPLRNVTMQTNKTEAELLQTLVEALPVTAQPLGLTLDQGLDTSTYAFKNLTEGQRAVQAAGDLIVSSLGYGHIGPTGVLRYANRQARQLKVSSISYNDDMIGLTVPATLDGVYNHVRATFHPTYADPAATTVLWAQTGSAPAIGPGLSIEIFGDYYKASEPSVQIAGTDQVPPAATTDYTANTQADGLGTDKTVKVTVAATFFATSVKFTVTNTDSSTVYLTKLQARGRGLYDLSPVTVESVSQQSYGDRLLEIDLPNQSNYNVTKDLADYLRAQYEAISLQAQTLTIFPMNSHEQMLAAMITEVGDRITVTESVTGLFLVDLFIQSVQITNTEGVLTCEFGVASATYFSQVWVMDDAVLSVMDTTTIFGYA